MSIGELLIEVAGRAGRRIVARNGRRSMKSAQLSSAVLACLVPMVGALIAIPNLITPASAQPAPEPQTEWQLGFNLRWPDLDALERAARDCGATRIERHRDSTGEWLSIGLDAEKPDKVMPCTLEWMDRQASATRVPDHAPPEPGASAFAVAGPALAIDRLEKVIRECGLTRIERKPFERGRVLLFVREVDGEAEARASKLDCAYDWMNAHPGEDLQLVVRTPGP